MIKEYQVGWQGGFERLVLTIEPQPMSWWLFSSEWGLQCCLMRIVLVCDEDYDPVWWRFWWRREWRLKMGIRSWTTYSMTFKQSMMIEIPCDVDYIQNQFRMKIKFFYSGYGSDVRSQILLSWIFSDPKCMLVLFCWTLWSHTELDPNVK